MVRSAHIHRGYTISFILIFIFVIPVLTASCNILPAVLELEVNVSSCLLPSKLYIPPANKNLIPRPRLVQILNDALEQDCHIILVSAPAGYGKTTLVTEWLRGVQAKTAWLSLDKADNNPTRFLTYLITALQQVDPSIGRASQAMLQSPQPLPPEALITPLIHDITSYGL